MEWSRPDQHLIHSQWIEFFSDPLLSLIHLKKRALQGKIKSLRSLYWRIFLGQLPGPINSFQVTENNLNHLKKPSWTLSLEGTRSEWERLKDKFLRAPDGLLLDDHVDSNHLEASDYHLHSSNHIHLNSTPNPIDNTLSNLGVNNPLSQHEANPWNVWWRDLELRKTIQLDVTRTFPELPYFRQKRTQILLTNILHVYCKIHEDVGYRQGMHEVLGVLLEALDADSLIYPTRDLEAGLMYQVLSREFLEHDAFNLFCLLMRQMIHWYDATLSVPIGDIANRESTPLKLLAFTPTQLAIVSPIESNCSGEDTQLVNTIVETCARIFHVYLKQLDPELWRHIDQLGIEPQLWGMRWLRLLFTREFTWQESTLLWDGIFAHGEGNSLQLVDFICIAMLLRIRGNLLESDYCGALQLILKFPKPTDGDSRIDLLLYQAILLSQLPTPVTVMSIIQQNFDLKLYSSKFSSNPRSTSSFSTGPITATTSPTAATIQNFFSNNHQPVPLQTGPDLLNPSQNIKPQDSRGLIRPKKTQSLGKPRSFLGALVGLRKSSTPTLQLPIESPLPITPETLSPSDLNNPNVSNCIKKVDQEKKCINELRQQPDTNYLANQEVGKALRLCVDALEQDMMNKLEAREDNLSQDSSEGLALGALKHIRDVMLSGFSSSFDSNVMSPLIEYRSAAAITCQIYSEKCLREAQLKSSPASIDHFDLASPTIDRYSPSKSLKAALDLQGHSFDNEPTDSFELSSAMRFSACSSFSH